MKHNKLIYRCYQCKKNFKHHWNLLLHWQTKKHRKKAEKYLKEHHSIMIKESNKIE